MSTTQFPIISWEIGVDSTNDTIAVTANAIQENLGLTTGDFWGYGTTTTGVWDSQSLPGNFITALNTHTQATVVSSVRYSQGDGWPGHSNNWIVTSTGSTSLDWAAGATTATSTDYGYNTGTFTVGSGDTSYLNQFSELNNEGFWAPGPEALVNVQDDRKLSLIAFTNFSPHEPAAANFSTTSWGEHTRRTMDYDIVGDEWLRPYRVLEASYRDRSSRESTDVNNILEKLMRAAVAGKTFRIYTAAGEYRTAIMDRGYNMDELITPVSNSGARFRVILPFIDLG